MDGKFSDSNNVLMAESETNLAFEKWMMLSKDSVPGEAPTIPSETTSPFPTQRARTANPPLPALAKEVLWYGHEKRLNESHGISYSPFIRRLQILSASIGNKIIDKTPHVSESFLTLWIEKDQQDTKHKHIAQLVNNQIKQFEDSHRNHDKHTMPRQFEGSKWFNESYDDAVIDYYDARKDQRELDSLRAMAWKAGARWRHTEASE
ncbi:hypothetical protein NHQ30_006196 [Ciborinia camelliae]|nr:hypothetical protein NHQ30_006196 [Ciborinia camelliae]